MRDTAGEREQRLARKLADKAEVAQTRIILAICDLPPRWRLALLNSVLRSELARAREAEVARQDG
jgi:hypothetical protein